jgi:hypothetical protein
MHAPGGTGTIGCIITLIVIVFVVPIIVSRSGRPMQCDLTRYNILKSSPPDEHTWAMSSLEYFWRGGYGRINNGREALELAADCHKALPRKDARWTPTSAIKVWPIRGVERDTNIIRGRDNTVWRRRSAGVGMCCRRDSHVRRVREKMCAPITHGDLDR